MYRGQTVKRAYVYTRALRTLVGGRLDNMTELTMTKLIRLSGAA